MVKDRRKVVIATRNRGKIRELQALLEDLGLELVSVGDIEGVPEVVEDGATFLENAVKKAVEVARATGLAAIADDSGLEVDALGGRPGVYSARYAGEGASDEDNYRKLLKELEGIPEKERTARFKCVMVAARPDGTHIWTEGACEGVIASEPKGSQGFGYDPVFYLPDKGRTMAQLSKEEKNAISHRGRAMRRLKEMLREFLNSSPQEA